MSPARARLAALATAAGYGPDTLLLIADAALPAYGAGDRLDETLIGHVATAVEVLAQCGYPAAVLPDLFDSYRGRYHGRRWRERFWRAQLRIAALRSTHPRFYGLSPCEADPTRLAEADAASAGVHAHAA
jgi:hypothetical protein